MKPFKFYNVDKEYINFLKMSESKIPNMSYQSNDKFVCGVLFSINQMNYFAPISSFIKQQRTNIIIKNSKGKAISSIRLSFMFPVHKDLLIVKDFSKEDILYRRLLIEELDFCNKNADKIISKAKYIYENNIKGNDNIINNSTFPAA